MLIWSATASIISSLAVDASHAVMLLSKLQQYLHGRWWEWDGKWRRVGASVCASFHFMIMPPKTTTSCKTRHRGANDQRSCRQCPAHFAPCGKRKVDLQSSIKWHIDLEIDSYTSTGRAMLLLLLHLPLFNQHIGCTYINHRSQLEQHNLCSNNKTSTATAALQLEFWSQCTLHCSKMY